MGFLGLFKPGKKAGNPSEEPEFLRRIDLHAAMQDEAAAEGGTAGRPVAPTMTNEVEPELALWLSNGLTARNLKELAAALKKMSGKEYKGYARSQNNEIAEWVQEILNDKQLAGQLRKTKNRIQATKLVEKASKAQMRAKITEIKAAKALQKARKPVKAEEKIKNRSSDAIIKKHEKDLDVPALHELPQLAEKFPLIEKARQEMAVGKPRPRMSLWPFSKKKKPALKTIPYQPTTEAGEISLPDAQHASAMAAPPPITAQNEEMPLEESLPEFPEEGDMPAENPEIQQFAESPELPVVKKSKAEPVIKPKQFHLFGMKRRPKAAPAAKPNKTPKKHMHGTSLQAYNAGPIPEAEKAEAALDSETEPQHAKWEDSSVFEEAAEEEKTQLQAEVSNTVAINGMDEQWKPDVQEHSPLDRQSKELEKIEQTLNREEEELNARRLELTRRRYDIIKQKGELERRRFEEFMEQHKLAPQNRDIVHKASPEQALTMLSEPEQPAAQIKGLPDFRLAGAYGKERLEELLEKAKDSVSKNNIEAAKRALDEVQSVFNTVYMTTSEKKHMEYEILEVEADLKLATLK